MQREAMNLLCRDDDNADEDWVAETPGPVGSRVELAAILFTIAKPERQRRRGQSRLRWNGDVVETHVFIPKGVAKDFVMIPSVKRVQFIDDDVFDDLFYLDADEDEWEVLPRGHSYAAVAHP
jgi:hypothetical protein